ncbi:MAG: Rrf2 family transcriptional regulator [Candidatus Bipolaricaulia bacterium]
MLYSKTSKYAVLALSEIARRSKDGAVPTRIIAEAAAVPYPLLAKILVQLKRAELVTALRGKGGGIQLARSADLITIRDVVVALDGLGILGDCPLLLEPCTCEKECPLHPIWRPAHDAVIHFLEATTIQAVADARELLDAC